jgi:hypothetical protein
VYLTRRVARLSSVSSATVDAEAQTRVPDTTTYGKHDMTNDDNLRTHIADLLSVLRERRCINDVLLQRAGHIRKRTRGDLSDLDDGHASTSRLPEKRPRICTSG